MSTELSKRAVRVLTSLFCEQGLTPHAVADFTFREVLLQSAYWRITLDKIQKWLAVHGKKLRDGYDVRRAVAKAVFEAARPQICRLGSDVTVLLPEDETRKLERHRSGAAGKMLARISLLDGSLFLARGIVTRRS